MILAMAMSATLMSCSHSDNDMSPSLADLDVVLTHRDEYRQEKESRIATLRDDYRRADSPDERYGVLEKMLNEYTPYNADSALVICYRLIDEAQLTGDPDKLINARLNLAEVLSRTMMFNESLDIVDTISSANVPEYLHAYLYHIKRTLYGLLADYSVQDAFKSHYTALTDSYRDSLLLVNDPNSLIYKVIKADNLNVKGRYGEAESLLSGYLDSIPNSPAVNAIAAFTLSNTYHGLGDRRNERQQLIISSISDMQGAIKEYISLRSLALMLYEDGDINHAYKYLKVCMDDAKESNARQRLLEINNIFQVVNDVYLDTIEMQKRRLRLSLWVVMVLVIMLVVSIVLIAKQVSKVSRERHKVSEMNAELSALNEDMRRANEKLLEANRSIAENSALKEEYIARYMDQCLVYIDRLDSYRKLINKLAMAGRVDDIKKQTKSGALVDAELDDFYDNFDETFLKMFPNFVKEFNALLRPGEEIHPKVTGKLNTELRIFALIRLGISDSVRIARFLRYSVTTIYNYRTRVRNRAAGDRDTLESQLMLIGSFKSDRK